MIVATATASWRTPERTTRAGAQEEGVTPDWVRSRLDRAIQPPWPGTPGRRRETDAERTSRPGRSARAAPRARRAVPARADVREPKEATSERVGRRFVDFVPGCVGTTFQRRTSSSSSSSRSTRCNVAVDSAGPIPVSWRSDVNGMPETRAPQIPGRLADEQDPRCRSRLEVAEETLAEQWRLRALGVLVERPPRSAPRRARPRGRPAPLTAAARGARVELDGDGREAAGRPGTLGGSSP